MDCRRVYRTMHNIKRECRYLTQLAQRAFEPGAVTGANAHPIRAFSPSKQLLELPVVVPDGVHYFVKACFNCIEYCYGEDDLFRTRQVQTAAALREVAGNKSNCIMVRRVALDCYIVVHRALVQELVQVNHTEDSEHFSNTFECVWQDFSAELIPMH